MIIALFIFMITIELYIKEIKLRSIYEKDFKLILEGDHYLINRLSFPRFRAQYDHELTQIDIIDTCNRKEMDSALKELEIYIASF
jgi:hypothetical protein